MPFIMYVMEIEKTGHAKISMGVMLCGVEVKSEQMSLVPFVEDRE